jgi:ribonuclease HII
MKLKTGSIQKKIKSIKNYEKLDWKSFCKEGFSVLGIDEVGRGCLAGPVYASAVILKHANWDQDLTDSKKLSETQRTYWSEKILNEHEVGIGFATVEEIEKFNILQASFLAMRRAIEVLNLKSGIVLVDGHLKIPQLPNFEQHAIVKGDLRLAPISAASIVAKVTRDNLMKELSKEYPGYGFEVHKGYATEVHRLAIRKKGITPQHRKTFGGVKEYLSSGV